MTTAIALKPDFWTSLVHMFQGFRSPAKTSRAQACYMALPTHPIAATASQSIRSIQAERGTPNSARRKPVRVLRVVEPGPSGHNAGRIVISGRMADVCAELDRLAANEVL